MSGMTYGEAISDPSTALGGIAARLKADRAAVLADLASRGITGEDAWKVSSVTGCRSSPRPYSPPPSRRTEMLTYHQIRCARKIHMAFAGPFAVFRYGQGHADTLRLVIDRWVFIVQPDGRVALEYPQTSPVPDLLDSDGPDYDPEAYAAGIDLMRKAAKENQC